MISGLQIRNACLDDLPAIKRLVDTHKHELGFVPLPALVTALERGWLVVADVEGSVQGMLNWWTRRDGVAVIYNIVVAPTTRGQGIGQSLLQHLLEWASERHIHQVALKCPVDLPANQFYRRTGFTLQKQETGKRRALNCWIYDLASA